MIGNIHANATTAAMLIWKAAIETNFAGPSKPETNQAVVVFREENHDSIWNALCKQVMLNAERTKDGCRFTTDFGHLPRKRIIDVQITDDLIEARYLGDA